MLKALHKCLGVVKHPWELEYSLNQGPDHLPVLCLGLKQSTEMLLLICVQHDEGLMSGLVDAGKALDNLGNCC